MNDEPIRIVIADSHEIVRDGMANVLKAECNVDVVGYAADGYGAIKQCRILTPDVLLMDEPFSALDALTRLNMQDLTARLLHGRTVLLVTHDPAEAARLGEQIKIMTPSGLIDIASPVSPIPRAVDAADVLSTQTKLLHHLRSPQ